MCRPSCCNKPGDQGTGIAAVAVLLIGAALAAKIGPTVARSCRIVLERDPPRRRSRRSVVVVAAFAWLARDPHWQLPTGSAAAADRVGPTPASAFIRISEPGCLACGDTGTVLRAIGTAAISSGLPGMPARTAGGVIAMPQSSPRNHRNNPYAMDRMFVAVHHSAAGSLWRFRTELTALTAASAGVWELAKAITVDLGRGHPGHRRPACHGAAVDPAAGHPAGLVRPVPAPHPAGLLRDPDAHPVRTAAAGAAHLPN